jgi:predicted metal-dependent hydrolase
MYDYRIIRSKRKTLSIQVDEKGEIIVRAPNRYSERKIERCIEKNSKWIENAIGKQQKRQSNTCELSEDDIKRLKALAKDVLADKVSYYSQVMNVKANGMKITSAKKRFGSCSGKNSICFSYILMLYPDEAIDYVVVHELAHIVQHNHSKMFYEIIAKVLPDYKNREKMLKGKQTLPY